MILEEFDTNKTAILNPQDFGSKIKGFPKTAVGFFSKDIMDEIAEKYNGKIIYQIVNDNALFPVYELEFENTKIAVTMALVGASSCVGNFEELIACGVENLLLVGSCGRLTNDLDHFSIILPTSAIRDEGTSYHYLPASDEVQLDEDAVKSVEKVLKDLDISYIKGKTWTTDALFRETRAKTNRRIEQGAIVVDMECSAMVALSKFRDVRFAQIFYAADTLADEVYDIKLLNVHKDKKSAIIPIALKCAKELAKRG